MELQRLIHVGCNRTGARVVIGDGVTPPPKPESGPDPYSHGWRETYGGDGWIARTCGDLLGSDSSPYRIFGISLCITPAAWHQAMVRFARYQATVVQRIPRTDAPLTTGQEDDLVTWMFDVGFVPANWPRPEIDVAAV